MVPEQISALVARLDELEAKVAQLEGGGQRSDDRTSPEQAVSRRRLIGMAGAAAAAGVGAAVATASPAGANDPNDVIKGVAAQSAGALETGITSSAGLNLATFRADNTSGIGFGIIGSSNGLAGVFGQSVSSFTGVSGSSSSGTGVGGTSSSGFGVFGGSTFGTSLRAGAPNVNNNGVHLWLDPGATAGPPTAGAHFLGQFWMDGLGVLFQCVVAGTGLAATWQRQAPLVILAAPVRIYDSRAGQAPLAVGPKTPLSVGEDRLIDATLNSSGVPAAASAVLVNLTVTGTAGSAGFLGLFKDGISYPNNSNINWFGTNQNIANAATTAVANSAKFRVHCGGNPTNVIFDVIGYYR